MKAALCQGFLVKFDQGKGPDLAEGLPDLQEAGAARATPVDLSGALIVWRVLMT
jgi:hypothetical protein